MKNIAVLDDESTTLMIVQNILEQHNFQVETFNDPVKFIQDYTENKFDILISDINMPNMNGFDVVKAIKKRDKSITIIMLTSSTDVTEIIKHFKIGISDYLIKPVVPDDMIHRIDSLIRDRDRELHFKKIEEENLLLELEHKKLVNWRTMYAGKDIKQTEQLISFLTRTINNGGGFLWLDYLQEVEFDSDGRITLDRGLYDLIIESANIKRKAIDLLSYINNLPTLHKVPFKSMDFVEQSKSYVNEVLLPIISKANRELSLNISLVDLQDPVHMDLNIHKQILKELVINAVKFSPEQSKIYVEIYKSTVTDTANIHHKTKEVLKIKVRNIPKPSSLKDKEFKEVVGIPYEFSEIIFDLFYTMESYQVLHDEEDWSHGTGLYIARKLANKLGCWIECKNISDFRGGEKTVYVEFSYTIPSSALIKEDEDEAGDSITLF